MSVQWIVSKYITEIPMQISFYNAQITHYFYCFRANDVQKRFSPCINIMQKIKTKCFAGS